MLISCKLPTTAVVGSLANLPNFKIIMETLKLKINKSKIARNLNVDRRTIDKYLDGYEKPKARHKSSRVAQYYDIIAELLFDSNEQIFYYKRVLWQYLVDNNNLNCPESTFQYYIRKTKEFNEYFKSGKFIQTNQKQTMRFETPPGEQAQLDWKESLDFTLKTGGHISINVLVLLLSYSRFRVYRLSLNKTQEVLFSLLTESFETFGGVPKTILTDNMKTVMDNPRTKYQKGKVNIKFDQFAKDFDFKVVPCIAAHPQTKAKVESQMKILDEIMAYNGTLDYVELNNLVNRINQRINSTLNQGSGKIPILHFEKEKGSLSPLPQVTIRNQYKILTYSAKVNTAAMISFKGNQYSVPPKYIGEHVSYQTYGGHLYIYFNTLLIAMHDISNKKLNYDPQHYIEIITPVFKKDKAAIENIAKNNLKFIGDLFNE